MVHPMAAGVTKPGLVSFRRFMRSSGIPRFAPALAILAALAFAVLLFAQAPTARAQCGDNASPAACPTPTPTPTLAFVSLDVTSGDTSQVINVTGGQFLPNEQTNLYWDTSNHVAGFAQADGSGNFNTRVKPFPGDGPGAHKLCASVQPNPCATFNINAPASPTPTPSPSPSPSPSESPVPIVSEGPTPSPIAVSLSGFDVISRPPFVFLPIAGALGVVLSLGYWMVSVMRRPRQRALPTAAVMHRATRPDYSAGFGTPPATPTHEAEPSAWNEPVHQIQPEAPISPPDRAGPEAAAPPPPSEPAAPEADWGPPVEWGTSSGDWGFPEPPPDDNPEPPPPAD
jgi:hypothetical protein